MVNKDKIYVCRCEEITVADIEQAIADGVTTIKGIKNRTDAGMGECQGMICHKLIESMLREKSVLKGSADCSFRFPVRPLRSEDYLDEEV